MLPNGWDRVSQIQLSYLASVLHNASLMSIWPAARGAAFPELLERREGEIKAVENRRREVETGPDQVTT